MRFEEVFQEHVAGWSGYKPYKKRKTEKEKGMAWRQLLSEKSSGSEAPSRQSGSRKHCSVRSRAGRCLHVSLRWKKNLRVTSSVCGVWSLQVQPSAFSLPRSSGLIIKTRTAVRLPPTKN